MKEMAIVTNALSRAISNHSAAICYRISATHNSTGSAGVVTLGQKVCKHIRHDIDVVHSR